MPRFWNISSTPVFGCLFLKRCVIDEARKLLCDESLLQAVNSEAESNSYSEVFKVIHKIDLPS